MRTDIGEPDERVRLKRPENFRLYTDSNGDAQISVWFRRENIPYLIKALQIVDGILAIDDEPASPLPSSHRGADDGNS